MDTKDGGTMTLPLLFLQSIAGAAAGRTLTAEFNGLTIGAGTDYPFAKTEPITGLFDMPDVRSLDAARSDHGDFTGTDTLASRTVTLHLVPQWTSAVHRETLIAELSEAFTLYGGAQSLVLLNTYMVTAKCRRRAFPGWYPVARDCYIELYCDDPRLYDADSESETAFLPTTSGGMTFPATFPITFGAASVGGSITALNEGNFPTRPIATIHGPLSNPRLTNGDDTMALTIDLAADDELEVDFDRHAITLNGTASRRSALSVGSVWWELLPGTNTVTFNAGTYDPAAFVELGWRSAWV